MGGRREGKLVTRLWERLFLVSGLLQRHGQECEPGQEKGNDFDPAEPVCGAGKGLGGRCQGFPATPVLKQNYATKRPLHLDEELLGLSPFSLSSSRQLIWLENMTAEAPALRHGRIMGVQGCWSHGCGLSPSGRLLTSDLKS